jgi:hypothetical protein
MKKFILKEVQKTLISTTNYELGNGFFLELIYENNVYKSCELTKHIKDKIYPAIYVYREFFDILVNNNVGHVSNKKDDEFFEKYYVDNIYMEILKGDIDYERILYTHHFPFFYNFYDKPEFNGVYELDWIYCHLSSEFFDLEKLKNIVLKDDEVFLKYDKSNPTDLEPLEKFNDDDEPYNVIPRFYIKPTMERLNDSYEKAIKGNNVSLNFLANLQLSFLFDKCSDAMLDKDEYKDEMCHRF